LGECRNYNILKQKSICLWTISDTVNYGSAFEIDLATQS
jgi:hypothetical protein